MTGRRVAKGIGIAVIGIAAVGVFGFIVMSLWNWLVPEVFGFRAITFWQALGILVLSRILFGGFRGGHRRNEHWKRRMLTRYARMTPEEREQFRQGMGRRCGRGFPAEESGSGATTP